MLDMQHRVSTSATGAKGVLFDLDGTLVNHFGTLYRCYRDTFVHFGLTPPDHDTVRRAVGGSMVVTLTRLLPDPALLEPAQVWWRNRFAQINLEGAEAMPGALWIVKELHARGLALGVLTNKIGKQSRELCDHLGFGPYLSFVLGAEDTAFRKPQRAFTELALVRLGTTPETTVIVGDSPYDIEAGRQLGMFAPCVSTGTHDAVELRGADADGVYPDLFTLGRVVFGLPKPA
jgi:phosphoglycolate phosphatase